MTVLASSSLHIRSTSSRALSWSASARSTSIYLPCLTSFTPLKPRPDSACSMAFPCGSSTPPFSVILMRAFMVTLLCPQTGGRYRRFFPSLPLAAHRRDRRQSMRLGAHQHRPGPLGARVFRKHPEPPRHFLIRLEHAAQVAAEAILVEL